MKCRAISVSASIILTAVFILLRFSDWESYPREKFLPKWRRRFAFSICAHPDGNWVFLPVLYTSAREISAHLSYTYIGICIQRGALAQRRSRREKKDKVLLSQLNRLTKLQRREISFQMDLTAMRTSYITRQIFTAPGFRAAYVCMCVHSDLSLSLSLSLILFVPPSSRCSALEKTGELVALHFTSRWSIT